MAWQVKALTVNIGSVSELTELTKRCKRELTPQSCHLAPTYTPGLTHAHTHNVRTHVSAHAKIKLF